MDKILVAIGVVLLIAVLSSVVVMLLWNALFPELFGLPTIGFWQAMGLNLLCTALFKNTSSKSSS